MSPQISKLAFKIKKNPHPTKGRKIHSVSDALANMITEYPDDPKIELNYTRKPQIMSQETQILNKIKEISNEFNLNLLVHKTTDKTIVSHKKFKYMTTIYNVRSNWTGHRSILELSNWIDRIEDIERNPRDLLSNRTKCLNCGTYTCLNLNEDFKAGNSRKQLCDNCVGYHSNFRHKKILFCSNCVRSY